MTITTTYGWNQAGPGGFANNLITAGAQAEPAITRVGTSGYALAWNDGQTNGDVRARFFSGPSTSDTAGPPIGDEFLVNSTTSGLQVNPAMATLADGRVVIAFQSGAESIRARIFSPTGTAAGSDFEIISGTGVVRLDPDVTALANGRFVVSYTRDNGGNDLDAYFAYYIPATGGTNYFTLNVSSTVSSSLTSVSQLLGTGATAGGFVAVWTDQSISGGALTGNQFVLFQRFDASGTPLDSNPVLIDSAGTINSDIQVLGLKDGGFAVAYTDNGWNISGTEITLAVFNADGSGRSGYVRVNQSNTNGDQNRPTLTQMENGIVVVGWTDGTSGYVKAFTPAGAALTGAEASIAGGTIESEITALTGGLIEHVRSGATPDAGGDQSIRYFTEELTRTSTGDSAGNVFNFTGDDLSDNATGGTGADTFLTGTGADVLTGGSGNDTYEVRDGRISVVENANEGIDVVYSYLPDYALTANVEKLFLSGSAVIGRGNDLDNTIVGNAGNNTLIGGAGGDYMYGGAGADTYDVRDAGDQVIENANEGIDVVYSYLPDYTLTANVEKLFLAGGAVVGRGNDLDNTIVGNAGNNTLIGGAGGDYMYGGAGDDTYDVRDAGDQVIENAGEGIDTVYSYLQQYALTANVEQLYLVGAAQVGIGNGLSNLIVGNGLNNFLNGGLGDDALTGGGGLDTFYWLGANAGKDGITDFDAAGGEQIVVASNVFADYAAIQAAETQVGGNVVITVNATTSLTLVGVTIAQLSAANFQFYSGPY